MLSQTQVANISALVGLLVIVAQQLGIVLDSSKTTFILGAVWSVGSIVYNYYQRYSKGDLTLAGVWK